MRRKSSAKVRLIHEEQMFYGILSICKKKKKIEKLSLGK